MMQLKKLPGQQFLFMGNTVLAGRQAALKFV
jgi:hypothetical protein